jgi:hypothetical protein
MFFLTPRKTSTMATILQGKRPDTFAPFDVRFKAPDGKELTIPAVAYRYRTRKEFAKLVDGVNAANSKPANPDGSFSLTQFFEASDAKSVDLLLDSIKEWGLEEPLNRETLEQLVDELPAAFTALWESYAAAARDGRLGN